MSSIETFPHLYHVWKELKDSALDNVPGVMKIDSGRSGPVVGVTIMTHGNEPAGLAPLWYFLTQKPLSTILQKGSVIFTLNNIDASEAYWRASTEAEVRSTRFADINMNRLPRRELSGDSSEERRARQLLPVWQKFDYAIDIHSTIQQSRPIIILGHGDESQKIATKFDIETVLGNMLNVQSGFPAISFYGGEKTTTLGVEVGGHYLEQSQQRAIQTVIEFLHSLDMIPDLTESFSYQREFNHQYLYEVYDKIIINHPKGRLVKVFKDFESISEGDILAIEPGKTHYAPRDGHTLFGPPQTQVMYPGEEILFLLTPRQLLE